MSIVPPVLERLKISSTPATKPAAASDAKPAADAKAATAPAAPVRTNFHLGQDDTALRARFLKAGFSRVVLWHMPTICEAASGHDFATRMLEGSYKSLMEGLSADQQSAIFAEVAKDADALIASGRALEFDIICIIAVKP
jgi:hypothetical protein